MSPIVIAILILMAAALGWGQRALDRRRHESEPGELPPADAPQAGTNPAPAETMPPQPPAGFRFRDGIACLAFFLLAQFLTFLVMAFVAVARAGVRPTKAASMAEMVRLVPVTLVLAEAFAVLALVVILRRLSRRISWEVLKAELGLSWGTLRANGLAVAGGLTLGALSLAAILFEGKHTTFHPGFLAQVVAGSTAGRLAWAVVAGLMAGPPEEVLFRGALLTAFRKVARVSIAGLASGFAFWLLHVPNFAGSRVGAASVALFAVFVTILRLRTGSLGPPVAAHMANNLLLAVLAARAA